MQEVNKGKSILVGGRKKMEAYTIRRNTNIIKRDKYKKAL